MSILLGDSDSLVITIVTGTCTRDANSHVMVAFSHVVTFEGAGNCNAFVGTAVDDAVVAEATVVDCGVTDVGVVDA